MAAKPAMANRHAATTALMRNRIRVRGPQPRRHLLRSGTGASFNEIAMWTPRALAVLISLCVCRRTGSLQSRRSRRRQTPRRSRRFQDRRPPRAQEFRVEDVASLADLPIAQLKPQDHRRSPTARPRISSIPGPGSCAMKIGRKARPLEQQFLGLYPGYAEPNADLVVDGVKKRFKEKLHMYVAAARFVLPRPPGSLDLARLITLPFVEQIDPAHQAPRDRRRRGDGDARPQGHLQPESETALVRGPADGALRALPLSARRAVSARHPARQQDQGLAKPVAPYLDFESEFTLRSPAEVEQTGLTKLTGLDTPSVGAIEQSIFYVNQVMQFGKLLAVFQQLPDDPGKTVVTVFMALAIEFECARQKEGIRARPGAAKSRAGAGACGQELIQYREFAERRPAGLCAQQRQGDRGPARAQLSRSS